MRNLTYAITAILLHLFCLCSAQTSRTYIQLRDDAGKLISGNSLTRGFEKQIEASKLTEDGSSNGKISFVMPVQAAAGILQSMQQGSRRLQNGQITVTQTGAEGRSVTLYTIRIEDVEVVSCVNNADNATTTVVLMPSRSGTTYYQADRKTGAAKVSSKSGYDWEKGRSWTNF